MSTVKAGSKKDREDFARREWKCTLRTVAAEGAEEIGLAVVCAFFIR